MKNRVSHNADAIAESSQFLEMSSKLLMINFAEKK
jgi:hypothetical protein